MTCLQFGHKLLEEEVAAPKEFKKSFIKYKSLKKFLKYRRLNTVVLGGNEALEAEKDFLRLLHSQLKEVDRCLPSPKIGFQFYIVLLVAREPKS